MAMHPMHICILTHLFPARSETFIREHAIGLRRRGHRVSVVARRPEADTDPRELAALDSLGISRIYIGEFASPKLNRVRAAWLRWRIPALRSWDHQDGWEGLRGWVLAASECRAIWRLRPDLIHVHFGNHAKRLLDAVSTVDALPPCVVTWHGFDVNAVPARRGINVYRNLFEARFRHTVGSQFIRQRLVMLGARIDAVDCIPMGVDLERFVFSQRAVDQSGPLKLLSVGRLEEVKGHQFLIAAVELLQRRGVAIQLRIAGGGRLETELRQQIRAAQLDGVVSLLGAISSDRVVEEMRSADLFVLTGVAESSGKVESQGLVYAEAQATGLPVIGSRLGGVPEALVDGLTGRLCEPGDVPAIAAAIERFAKDPDARALAGHHARRFVEERFSRESMLDQFEAVYARCREANAPLQNGTPGTVPGQEQ